MIKPKLKAIELFAGVGGFRLGLLDYFDVVWSNQWEPSTKRQDASEIYNRHFLTGEHLCQNIEEVIRGIKAKDIPPIPDHDLLVGGFPCQDYSVARVLNQAEGLVGKKGVLWWSIYELLSMLKKRKPRFILLENVDRLLKSPAGQRGRDFAVMLASLAELGYQVQWRVINAAEYGFPQRRRRVFIVGEKTKKRLKDPYGTIMEHGILARALPVTASGIGGVGNNARLPFSLKRPLEDISESFGLGDKVSQFRNAGVMQDSVVHTFDVSPLFDGPREYLKDVLQPDHEVDESFYIPEPRIQAWRDLKDRKKEKRIHRGSGAEYYYSEGAVAFPDDRKNASRTVLTGEGGSGPSRFKHVIQANDSRFRRLTPLELEKLNGFSGTWTEGISDSRRAFMMGNALVIGVVKKIAAELNNDINRAGPGSRVNHKSNLTGISISEQPCSN
jgi:DNA (cytosine-5)-methyltransferase 1